MNQGLHEKIASVFSMLPEADAAEAIRDTLRRIRLGTSPTSTELRWADFTKRGQVLRAGVTRTQSLSVHLLPSVDDDPEIAAMVAEAADGGIEPGRIIRDRDGTRFFWFVPTIDAPTDSMPTSGIRGIVVSEGLFGDLVDHFNPGRTLTRAEKRVLFQLTAGCSLREAADLDQTSVETKRSQVKSLCAKMQCSGQLDLVRTVIGQMFHLAAIAGSESAHVGPAEIFVARHFARDVAVTAHRLPSGSVVICLEAGPQEGQPVLLVHGMMFGVMLSGVGEWLEKLGVRLLVPIRPGYLQSFSMGSIAAEGELTQRAISDTASFIRTVLGGPVPILGQSLGAGLALRLAQAHPELVASLTLISTNLTQTLPSDENFAGHLYSGLRDLGRQPGLCRLITWQFRKYYADVDLCRTILSGLFSACEADLAVLHGRTGRPSVPPWFSDLYQSSVSGIADDFHFTMTQLPCSPRQVSSALTVIHGEHDPITRIDEVRRLVRASPGAKLLEVAGAGHFAVGSHPEQVWPHIAAGISGA